MKSNEIVNIFIGSAGLGISQSLYDQYCHEHFIGMDGKPTDDSSITSMHLSNRRSTMFRECKDGTYISNALIIDSEPESMAILRKGQYRNLFPQRQLTTIKEQACTYASSYYHLGKQHIEEVTQNIRMLAESANNLQGFNVVMSIDGGLGSGFGGLLLEKIKEDFGKKMKFCSALFPHTKSDIVIGHYNTVLSLHKILEPTDIITFYDNTTISQYLDCQLGIYDAEYADMNQVIARSISMQSAASRFSMNEGCLVSMQDLYTSMVPYDRIKIMIPSMVTSGTSDSQAGAELSAVEMAYRSFDADCSLAGVINPHKYKIMTTACYMRCSHPTTDLNAAFAGVLGHQSVKWTDWSAKTISYCVDRRPTTATPHSAGSVFASDTMSTAMVNSGAAGHLISVSNKRFDLTYGKRAFIPHFGMEEGDFVEARQDLVALEKDYEEVCISTAEEEEN